MQFDYENNVHLGCGEHFIDGWINTDMKPLGSQILRMDITEKFPFQDNSIDRFFCEHLIEHVEPYNGLFALKEMYRCLKFGGRIRLTTPNLRNMLLLMSPDCPEIGRDFHAIFHKKFGNDNEFGPIDTLNCMFYFFGHRYLYDFPTLKSQCHLAGFRSIQLFDLHKSNDEKLAGLERHLMDDRIDLASFESFSIEAEKI
jgi:SAM-dependent methyltransferase